MTTRKFPIPEGTLVLMVGIPGSGKSTLAHRLFQPYEILNPDSFREMLTNDAGDQSASGEAFDICRTLASGRLKRGLTTVIDATSTTARARRDWIAIANGFGRPTVAIVCDVSFEQAWEGNLRRTRIVPRDRLEQMAEALNRDLPGIRGEGFAVVIPLRDRAQLDSFQTQRIKVNQRTVD